MTRGVGAIEWSLPQSAELIRCALIVGPNAVGIGIDKRLELGIGRGGVQDHEIADEYAFELLRVSGNGWVRKNAVDGDINARTIPVETGMPDSASMERSSRRRLVKIEQPPSSYVGRPERPGGRARPYPEICKRRTKDG